VAVAKAEAKSEVMVVLVSEQRMQNLIPCFQKDSTITDVYLVRSSDADNPDSRLGKAWSDTKAVLEERKLEVVDADVAVDAYDPASTEKVVKCLLDELAHHERTAVVNFTGGTKCMAVGAYLAARQAGVATLYVDTARRQLLLRAHDDQPRAVPFELEGLSIDTYFRAYGLNPRVNDDQILERYEKIMTVIRCYWPGSAVTLDRWGKHFDQKSSSRRKRRLSGAVKVSWRPSDEVECKLWAVLEEAKLFCQKGEEFFASTEARQFLTGRWLECLTYQLLRESNCFDEVAFDLHLTEKNTALAAGPGEASPASTTAPTGGAANQLDVVTIEQGNLAVFECKSGNLRGQDTLNKLQALWTRLGTFARLFLVTSCPRGEISEDFRYRARAYRLARIITCEDLEDAGKLKEAVLKAVGGS